MTTFIVVYKDWECFGDDDERRVDRTLHFDCEEELVKEINVGNIPRDAKVYVVSTANQMEEKLELYWDNYWKKIDATPFPSFGELANMVNVSGGKL